MVVVQLPVPFWLRNLKTDVDTLVKASNKVKPSAKAQTNYLAMIDTMVIKPSDLEDCSSITMLAGHRCQDKRVVRAQVV